MKDTPERREQILQFLREGCSFAVAAGKAGICRDTLSQWRKADREFANHCEAAACEGIADVEDAMTRKAKNDDDPNSFQAAKFILERRKQTRDEYSPAQHNTPLVALPYYLQLNPLADIAPDLMRIGRDPEPPVVEGEVVERE